MTIDMEKVLGADDILSAVDRSYDLVKVPEWGGVVRIQSMTAEEHILFMDSGKNEEDRKFSNIRAVVMSCVNESGNLLFKLAQVEALSKKNGRAFLRVVEAIKKINGWEDDVKNG